MKQSLGKSIAQKCGRILGLRTPRDNPPICVHKPTEELVHTLSARALEEHELESRRGTFAGKISRSNSCLSGSTRGPDSPSDSCTPSKRSVASLPGSVESDDEEESPCHDPSCQQAEAAAELKRIAKLIGQKADFTYRNVRNAFVAVDADGDGRLSASEVKLFCAHFGISESVASRFYALIAKDEYGNANWQKFMALYAPVFKEVQHSAEPPSYGSSRLCLPRGQRW